MIDRASITNWGVEHPWPQKEFIEQDLVICRAIVSIFSDSFLSEALAFRGGTALHKIYLSPQARYSEDIDLVQVSPGPAKPIVERLDAALSWLPGKTFDTRRFGLRLKFRYDSEFPPSSPMRLKVEINTVEHFSELGYVRVPFQVESTWFTGACNVKTFYLDELLGTKLRALYQRRKGRDLFDLAYALEFGDANPDDILRCWRKYMTIGGCVPPTMQEFIANMEEKIAMPDYGADVALLLRPGIRFSVSTSFQKVCENLISPMSRCS